MKKSEIKIGEDYAYSAYEHSRRERVTILAETTVPGRSQGYWDKNPKPRFAWLVRNQQGTEFATESRNIYTTWDVEAGFIKARREAAISTRKAVRDGWARRAPSAHQANHLFIALGLEDREHWLPRAGSIDMDLLAQDAAEHGFHVFWGEEGRRDDWLYFVAASEAVVTYYALGSPLSIPADLVPALVDGEEFL